MKAITSTLFILSGICFAQSTIDSANKYAYSANTGWIDFSANTTNGVVLGEYFLQGYAWSPNIGWINFGNGSPSNGRFYTNSNNIDFGVNHDRKGNLTGYAYSANTGWINFGWTTSSNINAPKVNLVTGQLSGYAYSANVGWINLNSSANHSLGSNSMAMVDTDSDGIDDGWERTHYGNLFTAGAATDSDKDGYTDLQEYIADTDPNDNTDYFKITNHVFTSSGTPSANLTWRSSETRTYQILYSNDVGITDDWDNSSLGTFLPDAGTSTTKSTTHTSNDNKFFRVRVLRPLTPTP